jgi:F0F1-type ATP synthase delta subunit
MTYSARHYAEVLYDALTGKASHARAEVLKRFISMLAKHHARSLLPQIEKEYEKIFLQKQGLKKVSIESASPLSQSVKQEIKQVFNNKVYIEENVNPELIAGLTIVVDDMYSIDASARTRINNLFT